jgi:Xaa-Pro aminopeptidase
VDTTDKALLDAQRQAEELFAEACAADLIRAGRLESEISADIHQLARERWGLRRHWHRRIVRSGRHTVLTYYDEAPDRRACDGDLVVLDFGPVFGEWEADYGRTYLIGEDAEKSRLVADVDRALADGRAHWRRTPGLTAGGMYDHVTALARAAGWQFGAPTAGHPIGRFPHERAPRGVSHSIRAGNPLALDAPRADGSTRHWILEIHFIDAARGLGAFREELLTL